MLTQKGAQQSCQCTNHELVHRPGAYQSADRLCRLFTSQRPPTPNSPLVFIETHPVISASLFASCLPFAQFCALTTTVRQLLSLDSGAFWGSKVKQGLSVKFTFTGYE